MRGTPARIAAAFYYLKAARYLLDRPWCWDSSHRIARCLLKIPLGLDIRCVGWRCDCRASGDSSDTDVNAPNDAGHNDNKHVDTKSPNDDEKARGSAAWIAVSTHPATLPQHVWHDTPMGAAGKTGHPLKQPKGASQREGGAWERSR